MNNTVKRRVVINVTKRDIELGGHIANNCPIFRAAKRVLPDVKGVGIQSIWYQGEDKAIGIPLPEEAQQFIWRRLSRYYTPEPFKFTVEV